MDSLSGDLPDELVEEILVKLPAPSVLNFKRVSKPWCELLSSPCFLHCHSLFPHSPSQPFAIFHPFPYYLKKHPIYTISLEHHEHILQLHELPNFSSWKPRRVASSTGILCILTMGSTFSIVNTATGESTHLPLVHNDSLLSISNFGFYFNPQNCKFKVLALCSPMILMKVTICSTHRSENGHPSRA
ncbi:hypothetical protein AMTRI_Chr09g36060 [Amborella trichopoda]